VEVGSYKSHGLVFAVFLFSIWALPLLAKENLVPPEVPEKFNLDLQTASRVRPRLLSQSTAASGRYETGRLVFERLIAQVRPPRSIRPSWELRILDDDFLNAFASPEGTIYVGRGLAQLAGPSTGLWAAILSHEIAHVVRRDWARRYLFEKSLEHGTILVLGDPGLPSASWMDSHAAPAALAQFCRQMELDADIFGVMLMARAGYHPDFAAALHHLLHSQRNDAPHTPQYAMHPCWEERDRELQRAYVAASIEFGHLWPEWYASPGGNPPVLVFAEDPKVRKNGPNAWELQIPMRCQNLAGAVEVVLRSRSSPETRASRKSEIPADAELSNSGQEIRQLTGCTSPTTTVTFALKSEPGHKKVAEPWTDAYVLDAWGTVLSRVDIPK